MVKLKTCKIGRVEGHGSTMAIARADAERHAAEAINRLEQEPLFGKIRQVEFFAAARADGAHYGFMRGLDGAFSPRSVCQMAGSAAGAFAAAARHAASIVWADGDDDSLADEVSVVVERVAGRSEAEVSRRFLIDHFNWHRRFKSAKAAGCSDQVAFDRASGLHAETQTDVPPEHAIAL